MRFLPRDRVVLGVFVSAVLMLGVVPAAVVAAPLPEKSKHHFAIEPGSFHMTLSSYQAGAHADMTTTFSFEHSSSQDEETYNDLKSTIVNVPAGFVGSDTAVPTFSPCGEKGECVIRLGR
jgi:hypothetical protein